MQLKVTDCRLKKLHFLKEPLVGVRVHSVICRFIRITQTVIAIFVGSHLACTRVSAFVNANGVVVTRQLRAYIAILERAIMCSVHFEMWCIRCFAALLA